MSNRTKNQVILRGYIGSNAEVKNLTSGPVCNFRIATTEGWTGKDGQAMERTTWHSIVLWGNRAQNLGQYLTKGRLVEVEGTLVSRTYQRKVKAGDTTVEVPTTVYEVKALKVELLDSPRTQAPDDAPPSIDIDVGI